MKRKQSTEKVIISIEKFFEEHNAKIQFVILVAALIIGAYFDICQKNELGIIIGLLLLVSGELISLSIKDSISQRKLNILGAKLTIK